MLTPRIFIFISLCFSLFSSEATHLFDSTGDRFIKLDVHGAPTSEAAASWDCVLDRKTALIWEVKTTFGLRDRANTYTWYKNGLSINSGSAGIRNGGRCKESNCDSQAYIDSVNRRELCSFHNWRLPTREELRSLINYQSRPPRASIDMDYFPHTVPQFYWSANSDANNPDSAWGIGFTFGYDYSYFKSDLGYVRLVSTGSFGDELDVD